ncbi:MAG: ATP-binding protein [Chloroflexales bacterium]
MKLSADKWRARWKSEAAFYGYRWVAWALAGISLTLPGHTATSLPRDAGILLLLGVINVAFTATAQGYLRLARRRPLVMALDILAGVVVVGISGGKALPFLPYALGALVLPALLGGWGGALIASTSFIGLDLLGLVLDASSGGMSLPLLAVRAATPLAFTGCWVAVGSLLIDGEQINAIADPRPDAISSKPVPVGTVDSSLVRLSTFADLDRSDKVGAGGGSTQQRAVARLEPTPRADAARYAIFDPAPTESLTFSAAINQLAVNFGRQGGVEVRVTTVGALRHLTNVQHGTLLRVAQEALLNISQHAHAHTVLITITLEPKAATLAIQDDGVGLLDGTYERPGMHALRALRYRLSELDGQLAVFESESGGVTVRATLPID